MYIKTPTVPNRYDMLHHATEWWRHVTTATRNYHGDREMTCVKSWLHIEVHHAQLGQKQDGLVLIKLFIKASVSHKV